MAEFSMIFLTLFQQKLLFITVYTQVIWRAFWDIEFERFSCVQALHYATILYGFSVWFFKMDFNNLPDYRIPDFQS